MFRAQFLQIMMYVGVFSFYKCLSFVEAAFESETSCFKQLLGHDLVDTSGTWNTQVE